MFPQNIFAVANESHINVISKRQGCKKMIAVTLLNGRIVTIFTDHVHAPQRILLTLSCSAPLRTNATFFGALLLRL